MELPVVKNQPSAPLLSILIPTFNREAKIRTAILQWVASARASKLKEEIEIVISDNCSTDHTEAACRELIQTYGQEISIRYYRNDTNLGTENNYFIGLQHCKGHYIWMFSDDDSPERHTLQHVGDILTTKRFDYIFVNYAIKSDGKISPSDLRLQTSMHMEIKEIFTSTNFACSYIGSNIFRREKINFERLREYVGLDWIHMFLLRTLSTNLSAYVVTAPLIIMNALPLKVSRAEKTQTDIRDKCDYYMLAHLNFLSFSSELEGFGFTSPNTKKSLNYLKSLTVRQIFYLKHSQRHQTMEQLKFIADQFNIYFPQEKIFCFLATVLLFSPPKLVNPIYLVGSRLVKLQRAIWKTAGHKIIKSQGYKA